MYSYAQFFLIQRKCMNSSYFCSTKWVERMQRSLVLYSVCRPRFLNSFRKHEASTAFLKSLLNKKSYKICDTVSPLVRSTMRTFSVPGNLPQKHRQWNPRHVWSNNSILEFIKNYSTTKTSIKASPPSLIHMILEENHCSDYVFRRPAGLVISVFLRSKNLLVTVLSQTATQYNPKWNQRFSLSLRSNNATGL